jgi:hypothetical protein
VTAAGSITIIIALLLAGCASQDQPAGPLAQPSGWKAVLIAGDTAEPAFDNAVDAMAAKLEGYGLRPADIVTLKASGSGRLRATRDNMRDAFSTLAPAPSEGCFVFITSHGLPRRGLVMQAAGGTLTPRELDGLLDRGCAERPTVVIASGCFSGIFAAGGSMPAPNRTILTAAQSDRASFGCSAERRFTIFDECVLENLQAHQPWRAVMELVRACVSRSEDELDVSPPSNPQLNVGRAVEGLIAF